MNYQRVLGIPTPQDDCKVLEIVTLSGAKGLCAEVGFFASLRMTGNNGDFAIVLTNARRGTTQALLSDMIGGGCHVLVWEAQ